MNQQKIGQFIAQCRKKNNYTQAQLAEKLNISDKTISKWETGKGMPDSSIMLELCSYLGINVNELLSGEYLKKEQYQEKVNENIINIAKESEKNKRIKNITILVFSLFLIFLILILITNIVYQNIQITIDYDSRLIECEIDDNYIICSFYGSSLITLNHKEINIDNETTVFITGKMFLQNKTQSHWESWESMAQLHSGMESSFKSREIIDIEKDIDDCKEKIKVYYTTTSFKKIDKANQEALQKIIEQSYLISEN